MRVAHVCIFTRAYIYTHAYIQFLYKKDLVISRFSLLLVVHVKAAGLMKLEMIMSKAKLKSQTNNVMVLYIIIIIILDIVFAGMGNSYESLILKLLKMEKK